jgi:UDP-N-acetylglucosamine transferase subunit ALG13
MCAVNKRLGTLRAASAKFEAEMPERTRLDVLVVCSAGGHLFDAVAISLAWRDRTHAWVSFDKADVRSLLAGERVYFAHGPTNRNIQNFLRNLRLAWRIVGDTKPRVVVTTGAGVGVPFAWVGWARRARIVYVECAGRVDRPSLSARMIAPVASRVYAQWPELARAWRPARYAGNVLQSQRSESASAGTGVLVTVGTNEAPFDRLLRGAATIEDEPLVVQYGSSTIRPARAKCLDYVPFDAFDELVRSARVVVTHAGIGSVAAALAHGRRPVVVPRLHRFGEAVDDHQVFFARQLEAAGLATVVEDVDRLPDVVARGNHSAAPLPGPDPAIEVRTAIDELLAAAHGMAAERSGSGMTASG